LVIVTRSMGWTHWLRKSKPIFSYSLVLKFIKISWDPYKEEEFGKETKISNTFYFTFTENVNIFKGLPTIICQSQYHNLQILGISLFIQKKKTKFIHYHLMKL
jgi:hypothetical protein